MKALDLFAGGGGASLGLHRAGYDVLGVEWDADACEAHRRIAGPCIQADISDPSAWLPDVLDWLAGEPLALLWASPPCQDWSSAGPRSGPGGERNGWPWTWAAVDALRAAGVRVSAVLAENVMGMTHHPKGAHPDPDLCAGCYLDVKVLGDARARFTHAGRWSVDAADYGVPQHRRRVIVWAAERRLAPPARTHHPTGGMLRPWWVGAGEALGQPVVGGGARGHGVAEWRPRVADAEPAPCVTGFGSTGALYTSIEQRRGAGMVARYGERPPAPLAGPAPAIRAGSKGGTSLYLRAENTGAAGRSADMPAPTTTGPGILYAYADDPGPRTKQSTAALGRRLTVEECAILQGWPEAAGTSYRIVGNAVPPALAQALSGVLQ